MPRSYMAFGSRAFVSVSSPISPPRSFISEMRQVIRRSGVRVTPSEWRAFTPGLGRGRSFEALA